MDLLPETPHGKLQVIFIGTVQFHLWICFWSDLRLLYSS